MIAEFFMYLGLLAVGVGVAGGISWLALTAWAWVERSDYERGLSFRMWLRLHR